MKVSVILASYDGEMYIIQQLQSILNQTRLVDEVLIADDRSTDSTVALIKEFIATNQLCHWEVKVNAVNLGYRENFHQLLECATGDLIFFSDQDDIWDNHRVDIMASTMEQNPSIYLLNTVNQNFTDETKIEHSNHIGSLRKIEFTNKTYHLGCLGCVMCVRRDFYLKVRSKWKDIWAHDVFVWSMALLHDSCYHLDYVSVFRRMHQNQASGHLGHTVERRVDFLNRSFLNCKHTYEYACELNIKGKKKKICKENMKCLEQRLKLVRDHKLYYALTLLFHLKYYSAKRSYLVELKLALCSC